MSKSSTPKTFEDPAEKLRSDPDTVDLFHRIAYSDAQCAPDFERALKNAGCWNGDE